MQKKPDGTRQKLIALGSGRLVDALLELAARNAEVADLVERMVAGPKENVSRFKSKLAALKRRRRFIGWSESSAYARELIDLLGDLKAGVEDPKLGAELVADFYQTDQSIFEQCDDSNGSIGDVFRHDARELFVHYAAQCDEKAWLTRLVLQVSEQDDYGVRDTLVNCASAFLPEPCLRDLADRFWQLGGQETEDHSQRHWTLLVESVARQIKDAPLFEKARRQAWPELPIAACIDIAEVYFDTGEAETALAWLKRIPADESFKADERDQLLIKVFGSLGNQQAATEFAWRIFRRHRSEKNLATLLSLIGEDQRDKVIMDESVLIQDSASLSYSDVTFLLQAGKVSDAERYLLTHKDQLNGDLYYTLLPLAEAMEQAGRLLVESLIYRALLDSILRRAQSKYYHHGIRYLKKLENLAPGIADWGKSSSHGDYFSELRQAHGRKSSFWSRYSQEESV